MNTSAGPDLIQAAEACAVEIIDDWKGRHESQLERDRRRGENTIPSDFSTFLRGQLAHLANPNSQEFEVLVDGSNFVERTTFPFFNEIEDPEEYIFRLSQTIHTQHEAEVIRRLAEESETLARLTGWSLYEIRQRITAEQRSVPESWRQRYPAPEDKPPSSAPVDND